MKARIKQIRSENPGRLIAAGALFLLTAITMLFPIVWGTALLSIVPLTLFGLPGYLLYRQTRRKAKPAQGSQTPPKGNPEVREEHPRAA